MNSGPNFGQGFDSSDPAFGDFSNQVKGGFGASVATCTSGLNPFDWGAVTQDCWDAIKADLKTKQLMEQTIWEVNVQGPVLELPAGKLRTTIGASTR
jgi:iron complex outermembrane recepter protein